MRHTMSRLGTVLVLLTATATPVAGQHAPPEATLRGAATRQYGLQVGAGIALAPMSAVAESFGTFAVAGRDYELRLVTRSPRGNERSIGLLADEYELDHTAAGTRSRFHYESVAVGVGRARVRSYGDHAVLSGGGDGYSALHRSTDIGVRASLGISVKTFVIGRGAR